MVSEKYPDLNLENLNVKRSSIKMRYKGSSSLPSDTMEIHNDLENVNSKSVIYNILSLLWKTLNPWKTLKESEAMNNKDNNEQS